MSKEDKKRIRKNFRDSVFSRDKFLCKVCKVNPAVDAHHITDRNDMPNGGYVKENGISLCAPCHELAEEFHSKGTGRPEYSAEALYKLIGSSKEEATRKSNNLK